MTPNPSSPSAIATRRSILLLSFATFTSMSAQRICDAMLPELSRVFGTGLPQAARVVSVFAIVYGVLQLFYGPLGDRLGKFRVIAWATLACTWATWWRCSRAAWRCWCCPACWWLQRRPASFR